MDGPAPEIRGRPIAVSRVGRWPENSQPFAEIAHAALRELQASAATLGAKTGIRA